MAAASRAFIKNDVIDSIFGGDSAELVIPALRLLPGEDRQNVLCTVCKLHNEIASNSLSHGREISRVLTSECGLYIDGVATCLLK